MTQTYTRRTRPGAKKAPEGQSISSLASGAPPTAQDMGSRVDLPGEIREKMESSFGADFSNVKLYESETVAEAGAEAVTQGNNIAFAPGKLDLTSTAGQALLGHELSHVVSQARGESTGQGFLNDPYLEAQADRQGMMAARGESVSAGPVSPIGASSTAGASGPIQAKKKSALQKSVEEATAKRGEAEFGTMDLPTKVQNMRAIMEMYDNGGNSQDTEARFRFANMAFDEDENFKRMYMAKHGSAKQSPQERFSEMDPLRLGTGGRHGGDVLEDYDTELLYGYDNILSMQDKRRNAGITAESVAKAEAGEEKKPWWRFGR